MGEVVLSAKNISISFGQRQVLDKIDIEIKSGEVTALLGPMALEKARCSNCFVVKSRQIMKFTTLVNIRKNGQQAPWRST